MSEKISGTVKWFRDDKGFGFIQSEGQEYFVHFSGILGKGFKSLPMGAKVSFNVSKGKKGMQAQDVEIINNH
ncbi:cold-shock protein [Legionella saoudiensis]|uniref:cold-shock protein n=1 Tax=Legionella saoudiensis TaxID=1750561 RepID=UPI000730D8F3|nr:cold shock domain-containing protein [Legionella saoudiensis]